jgi:hypothetical protein
MWDGEKLAIFTQVPGPQSPLEVCASSVPVALLQCGQIHLISALDSLISFGLASPDPLCCNRSDQPPNGNISNSAAPDNFLSAVDAAGGGDSCHLSPREMLTPPSTRPRLWA